MLKISDEEPATNTMYLYMPMPILLNFFSFVIAGELRMFVGYTKVSLSNSSPCFKTCCLHQNKTPIEDFECCWMHI